MTMLGLFRSPVFTDPELGALRRSRRRWRGTLVLGGRSVPLAVAGGRAAPDASALALARALPEVWTHNRDAVARAFLDHLSPYRDAVAAGEIETPGSPLPAIAAADDVWRFVELVSASVVPLAGSLVAEVALAAAWDEEHTLGARFEGLVFRELNGSILPE